jgi:hypothetical protein
MNDGDRVIALALGHLGVRETRPNRGPEVDRFTGHYGMQGVPWCGCFVGYAYAEAGVDDAGLCSPSVAVTCERADALGGLAPAGLAPPGTLMVKCGVHVGLVVRDRGDGVLDSVEGNTDNMVARRTRAKSDWRLIVPPALAAQAPRPPITIPSYGFDDLNLKPNRYGGWATPEARDAQMAAYQQAHPTDWTRALRTTAPAPYAFEAGPAGNYGAPWKFGGWASKATRDAKMASYQQAHPLAPLRPWATSVPVPAGAPPTTGDSWT